MNRRAVTLIELIMSTTIIAILFTVVLVSLSSLERRKLDVETVNLLSDFRWTRLRTISIHQYHAIAFSPANREYSIYVTPHRSVHELTPANLIKTVSLESNIAVNSTVLWFYPAGDTSFWFFTFYTPGGTTSGTDNITLSLQGVSKQITIEGDTGFARIMP